MKILLSGGGTMGSVSPLIAVYQRIKKHQPDTEILFIGTKNGPEKKVVAGYNIPYQSISAGRWRRFLSFKNLATPFQVIIGFSQALFIMAKFKPNAVMIAGAFVGVPVAWAAKFWRIPILIHQQDIIPGLANKLMANIATKITVSFEISVKDFFANKTVLTGNPIREEIFSCDRTKSRRLFNLSDELPLVLILGGGTGAQWINDLVEKSLADLLQFCQVIHITGRGKKVNVTAGGYQQFEFLANEMQDALCAADLVISRAGLSTLSELIVLGKSTVIIPMPDSHQETNAQYLQKNNAILTLAQDGLSSARFVSTVKELMSDKGKMTNLSRNIFKMMNSDGAEKVASELLKIAR